MLFLLAFINLISLFSGTKEEPYPIGFNQKTEIRSIDSIDFVQHEKSEPYTIEDIDFLKNIVIYEIRTSKKKRVIDQVKYFSNDQLIKPLLIIQNNLITQKNRSNLFLSFHFSLALFQAFLL